MYKGFPKKRNLDPSFQLAKKAYSKYALVTNFKNFRGEPMPEFDDLPELIQQAWMEASIFCFESGKQFSQGNSNAQ